MQTKFYKKFHPIWQKKYAIPLKRKRLDFMGELLGVQLWNQDWQFDKEILEIGCSNGKDFIQFFMDSPNLKITGVDNKQFKLNQANATFLNLDAEKLPFQDNQFDLCVSFGVLEHIQPIEKLCRVISEISRVSKSYAVIVPSIATVFEPHTAQFFWPARSKKNKRSYPCLNYFSDEAWLQFEGFSGAKIKRYSYIPFFIRNSVIYKTSTSVE